MAKKEINHGLHIIQRELAIERDYLRRLEKRYKKDMKDWDLPFKPTSGYKINVTKKYIKELAQAVKILKNGLK